MTEIFQNIAEISIMASFMIVAVLAVRICAKKTTAVFRCCLWVLVGIRLLVPVNISMPFSLVPNVDLSNLQAEVEGIQGNMGIALEKPGKTGNGTSEQKHGTDEARKAQNDETQSGGVKGTYGQQEVGATQGKGIIQSASVAQNTFEMPGNELLEQHTDGGYRQELSVMSVLIGIWLSGTVLMLGYMVIGGLRLRGSLAMAVPESVSYEGKEVKIYRDAHIESPFLLGMWGPKIYVPYGLDEPELKYVLAHELMHIRRRDYLLKPLSFAVLAFYWFHPLVWVAYILLGKDIECACDEQVLRKQAETEKTAYASALLSCVVSHRKIAVCPIAFGESDVKKRVKNVLSYKKPGVWAVSACVLLGIVMVLLFMTVAESSAKELTMEGMLKLSKGGRLQEQIENKGLDLFEDYENVEKVFVPKGAVASRYLFDLEYNEREYELEVYYQLPKEEGEEPLVDTVYVSFLYNQDKKAIYSIRENTEVMGLEEYLDYIDDTYTLDTYMTYELPVGFDITDIKTGEGLYSQAYLTGDVEAPIHPESSQKWEYGPGGIGLITEFPSLYFENGELIWVNWMSNGIYILEDTVEKVEGCFTSALLAEVGVDMWSAAAVTDYAEVNGMTIEETMKLCETVKYWYVFICDNKGEAGYVVYLNQSYFAKEEAIAFARSIKPMGS